jgi:hypothetical protein
MWPCSGPARTSMRPAIPWRLTSSSSSRSPTSLTGDRRVKIPLYARAGVGEVWFMDLTSARVEVYRVRTATGYGHVLALGVAGRSPPRRSPI